MNKRVSKIFWVVFVSFAVFAALFLGVYKTPVEPEMNFANAVIMAVSILVSGGVLRYWFYKNQDKFKG